VCWILDEYADEKAGGRVREHAAIQWRNGEGGYVPQVAVALGYANWKLEPCRCGPWWMPRFFCRKSGLGAEYAELRQKVGVPKERTSFETKPETGVER